MKEEYCNFPEVALVYPFLQSLICVLNNNTSGFPSAWHHWNELLGWVIDPPLAIFLVHTAHKYYSIPALNYKLLDSSIPKVTA
jgi:hypothetical protein